MSELQEGHLKEQELPAKTLAEAFGFSMDNLCVTREDGQGVSAIVRERVIRGIQTSR